MDLGLEGKVAVVTGGAQGIGRGIAERLLEEGMAIALLERDEEAGFEAERALAPRGTVRFLRCDVAKEEEVRAAIAGAAAALGGVFALVNNAGVFRSSPLETLSLAEWNEVLATNLTSAMLCTREAAPHLRRAKGAVVNIASTRALQSEKGTEAYAATKGGIVALTHALAISLGPEVRVNCVSPGWIEVGDWKKAAGKEPVTLREEDHAQHPAGRVGRPPDIGALVATLLSPVASGFVTGANVIADGGMTRKMIYAE